MSEQDAEISTQGAIVNLSKVGRLISLSLPMSYEESLSIQESSAADPHLWVGVHHAKVQMLCSKARAAGLRPLYGDERDNGWCDIDLPPDSLVASRVHMNVEQARQTVEILQHFIEYGNLEGFCPGKMPTPHNEEPNMASVFLFPNGMVFVFDRQGEQMPEYQGRADAVGRKIAERAPVDCKFECCTRELLLKKGGGS